MGTFGRRAGLPLVMGLEEKNVLPCPGNCYKRRDSSGLGRNMRKVKGRQGHSLPFGLLLTVVGALLLLTAGAPRANADPMGRSSKHLL